MLLSSNEDGSRKNVALIAIDCNRARTISITHCRQTICDIQARLHQQSYDLLMNLLSKLICHY